MACVIVQLCSSQSVRAQCHEIPFCSKVCEYYAHGLVHSVTTWPRKQELPQQKEHSHIFNKIGSPSSPQHRLHKKLKQSEPAAPTQNWAGVCTTFSFPSHIPRTCQISHWTPHQPNHIQRRFVLGGSKHLEIYRFFFKFHLAKTGKRWDHVNVDCAWLLSLRRVWAWPDTWPPRLPPETFHQMAPAAVETRIRCRPGEESDPRGILNQTDDPDLCL